MNLRLIFERLPVAVIPGFDCIYDHANCPACKKHGENDHGISGGRAFFVMKATRMDGMFVAAIALEVLTTKFPSTIPPQHWHPDRPFYKDPPRGATLSIHVEGDDRECEWVPSGKCSSKDGFAGYLAADKMYREHGNQDPAADPADQSDALWLELAGELQKWIDAR